MKQGFIQEKLMWHISSLGTALFVLVLAAAVLLMGEYTLSAQLFSALAISFLVVMPIKFFFHRERPDKRKHKNWIEKLDAASFPSVHSNRAALLFIIISVFFGKIYLTVFLAIVSVLIAYSRVYLKRHYLSDVLAGYFLGLLEGVLIIFLIQ